MVVCVYLNQFAIYTSWTFNPSFFSSASWLIYQAQISHHVGIKIFILRAPKNALSVWFPSWDVYLPIVCLSVWFHLISFFSKNNGFRTKMYKALKIYLFIRYNFCSKYFVPRSIFMDIKWKNLLKKCLWVLTLKIEFAGIFIIIFRNQRLKIRGYSEFYGNRKVHLFWTAPLTLSGAHFSGASTPDMIVTIRVFGVADYESEVRFSKFKMTDPIWRSKFLVIFFAKFWL